MKNPVKPNDLAALAREANLASRREMLESLAAERGARVQRCNGTVRLTLKNPHYRQRDDDKPESGPMNALRKLGVRLFGL